jgi:hypothetical protein
LAWRFTQAREKIEGRRITKETFITSFLAARKNVRSVIEEFNGKIEALLILQNYQNQIASLHPISAPGLIEEAIPRLYSAEELEEVLKDA